MSTHTPAPTTTGPPTTAAPVEPDGALRLTSVLASGLPGTIGTPDEPARYTVPAVFSRQVTREERARIEDPAAARALPHAGPDLHLEVADRRLLIGGTTLAELRDGLAADLAAMLRTMGEELGAEHRRLSDEAGVRRADEAARAASVVAAAEGIRFE